MDVVEKYDFTKKINSPKRRPSVISPQELVNTLWHRSHGKIVYKLVQACENSVKGTQYQTKLARDLNKKEVCWIKCW